MSYLLAFAGFSALVMIHELGHFWAAKKVGMRVERFSLFFPPHIWKKTKGETEYCIGLIPLGGYVRIMGMNPNEEIPPELEARSYSRMAVNKRIFVIAAGPLMNVLVAFVIFFGLFVVIGLSSASSTIDQTEPGSPAATALKSGDKLISVDGQKGDVAALGAAISKHRCPGAQTEGCAAATPARVIVERAGTTQTLLLTPRYDAAAKKTRLGFNFAVERETLGPVAAASRSATEMWRVTTLTMSALSRLAYDPQARKEISGVVGSYEVTRQSFEFDVAQALSVLAIISLSLALINLFPFLPLDGGHIFWAIAEKLRGRPIAYSVMERASAVGFVLILILFAVGLTNDISRLQGEGFGLR
jgi:regulator of sigma E protease